MAQMPDSFKPIDMPDSFQPITISQPELTRDNGNGMIESGNIDLAKQPRVPNPITGGISTVYSKGMNIDGKEYLLPSVTPDGRFLKTDQEIADEFRRTGKHLGAFKDIASSNAYAQQLHNDYESGKYDQSSGPLSRGMFKGGILDPNVSLLDKAKNVLFGQKTDTEGHQLQGPGLTEIPGVSAITDKLQHAIDPTESPFYTGLRPLAAGAVKLIGGTLASGFDPRTAGIKSVDAVPPKVLERTPVEVPKVNVDELQPSLPLELSKPIEPPSRTINASLEPPIPTEQTPAIAKLQTAIESIKPLNKEQQQLYSLERSERLGKMKGVSTPGQAGYYEQLGQLKGSMEKVIIEPIKLDQPDVDELFNTISSHPASIGYNEIKAKTGLAKLLQGQVPTQSEASLLRQVFGDSTVGNLESHIPTINKAGGLLSEAVNLPKSLMASFDMSAPFRQGLGLAHKKEFWTSFDDMVKSFGSEKAFQGVQQSIQEHPNFQLSQDSGLHLSNLTDMTNREEAFMSSWAERIPGIGRVVRASDRAYVGFLNKLRFDTFSRLMDDSEIASKALQSTSKDPTGLTAAKMANPKTNPVLANEFANFVNTATGRGNLGRLEPSAVALNNMFFSPRLIASRVRMLNPQTYISASPAVRKEYIKSLLAIAAVGGTIGGLGKLAGGTISDEQFSSDLGKIKFGDTRLDPFGGFQQYIVAANRLLQGKQTSSTSGNTYELGSKYGLPTRLDVLKNFTANKLAPIPKFAYDLLNANKQQPFSFSDESARLFIPMVIQDTIDLANSNPKLIPGLVPLSGLGMGVQTYPQPGITTQIGNLVRR